MKNFFLYLIIVCNLSACIPKNAFQPGPSAFKGWAKADASEKEVKQEMLNCGHQNPYTPDSVDTMNDRAIKEVCMLNKGFKRSEGNFKGICYGLNWQEKPACVEYRKTHPNPPS